MSFSAPGLLRVFVCACVVGGVVELLAAPQHSALHESAHATDSTESTILEQLPLDFIVNRGYWQTPARFVARKGAVSAAFRQCAVRS